ncbi:hypothetical protein GOODEAATRI_016459, partial [Goodea atripinnis]
IMSVLYLERDPTRSTRQHPDHRSLEGYKEHSDEKVTGRMTPYHTNRVLTSLRPAIPNKRRNTDL